MIGPKLRNTLERQHYKIAGNHSAVKLCLWTKKSLRGEGFCYKQQFYGIRSHRCLQFTPAVAWCTHRCVHCWRNIEHAPGTKLKKFDEPEEIVEMAVEKQRELLTGFGGIPEIVERKKLGEARNPNQVAISLTGEPMIYPHMGSLLEEFHRRKFNTFLVTNGTFPERIKNLEELPKQLYVSLNAPDEKLYKKVCNPMIPDGWKRMNETINFFPSIKTRKVVRLTLVKNLNMLNPEGYAKLIRRAEPDFVECKAFMFLGGSRKRLAIDNMPNFPEIMNFSRELAGELGYKIKDSKEDSRVVLLSKK